VLVLIFISCCSSSQITDAMFPSAFIAKKEKSVEPLFIRRVFTFVRTLTFNAAVLPDENKTHQTVTTEVNVLR